MASRAPWKAPLRHSFRPAHVVFTESGCYASFKLGNSSAQPPAARTLIIGDESMKRCCYCRSRLWLWQWESWTVNGVAHAPCYFQVLESQHLEEVPPVVHAISVPTDFADDEPTLFASASEANTIYD